MALKAVKLEVNEEEVKRNKRLMEGNELKKLIREETLKRDVSEKKDVTTEKQKKVIAALQKENANLASSLKVMTTERHCSVDTKQAQETVDLFGQGDGLDLEIAREKEYIADLEEQIRKEAVQLDKQRRDVKRTDTVTDFGLKQENQRKDRLLESLKTRLHAEQVHLGAAIKDNEGLRQKITVQIKSKSRFNEIFQELIQKLNKGKNILKAVVEQTQATFKKREELSRKMQALREKDAADLRKRQEEMQDLQMKLVEDINTNSYKQKVMTTRDKLSGNRKANKNQNVQHRQVLEQDLQELLNAFDYVKEKIGLSDVGEICDTLCRQESDNFSLFTYNNEIRYQLEALTERTIELMRKVNDEEESAFQHEGDNEAMQNKLESTRAALELVGMDVDEQRNASRRTLDRLLDKIEALFEMANCDHWPLEQLLGDNKTVTKFNYWMYLDLIETRLVELISACFKGNLDAATAIQSKMSTMTPTRKSVPRPTFALAAITIVDRKVVTRPCLECPGGI